VLVVIDVGSVMAAYAAITLLIGIRYVILAQQWMWLPDDGFM